MLNPKTSVRFMPMGEDSEKKNPPGNSKEWNYAGGGGRV